MLSPSMISQRTCQLLSLEAATLGDTPKEQQSADIESLLAGLDDDDLNDFEGLDEKDNAIISIKSPQEDTTSFDGNDPQQDDFLAPLEIPAVIGFATASGRKLAKPSDAAMARALKIVQEAASAAAETDEYADESIVKRRKVDESLPFPSASLSGFSTGTGGNVPPVSNHAARVVNDLFSDAETGMTGIPREGGFRLGSGQPVLKPSSQSIERAFAIFGETESSAGPSTPHTSSAAATFRTPMSTVTPLRSSTTLFGQSRSLRSGATPVRPSTPTRFPLQTTTNTFATHGGSPYHPKVPRPIEIKTPMSTPRRIGLGSSRVQGKSGMKRFVTPFKQSLDSDRGIHTPISRLRASVIAIPKSEIIFEPIFDLTLPPARTSLRASYLYPQFYSATDLREMGIPDEIGTLNLENALSYQFIAEDASTLGHTQAYKRLLFEKCKLVTAKWVDNHWRMILWKLAGQVMAKPILFDEKWTWFEVLSQLKYRYEREFGAAQRPIVRRIQEHDSSPSLPMILCVTGIHIPPPTAEDKDGEKVQHPFLDLTDGWYKIRAMADACLARAITKGKIKVGRKLGISGAKLQSGSDGDDVLEAFDNSYLILCGNSAHLARWDAKLGAQPRPFIASLSSLSSDGGSIVLMDIMIEKLFPVAFMSSTRGSREPPWNEEEEATRADQWRDRYENELLRLQEETKKNMEQIEELASILASYAEEVSDPVSNILPDNADSDFDDLLGAKDVMSRLRALSGSQVVHLAHHARLRVEQAAMEERAELEAKISEICPPREVRDFRMARFVDAQQGRKNPARVGMLNVWDVRTLGEDALEEGKRYLVSNLVPGRNGDWSVPKEDSKAEVYLHTRRDTRWKAIPLR